MGYSYDSHHQHRIPNGTGGAVLRPMYLEVHTMKKYKVVASYLTFCELEVEAENEDEAWELAREADGG